MKLCPALAVPPAVTRRAQQYEILKRVIRLCLVQVVDFHAAGMRIPSPAIATDLVSSDDSSANLLSEEAGTVSLVRATVLPARIAFSCPHRARDFPVVVAGRLAATCGGGGDNGGGICRAALKRCAHLGFMLRRAFVTRTAFETRIRASARAELGGAAFYPGWRCSESLSALLTSALHATSSYQVNQGTWR
jgi:hypothetical protein